MKERIDKLLVEQGFFETREKAKRELMSGNIFVNNQRVDKPGFLIKIDAKIEIKGQKLKYVSRGGLKLEKAILENNLNLKNLICIDIGASTGGFTDCMLQNGAKKVYSVDVGTNQLDYKLQIDERVIDLSKTNAKYLTTNEIQDKIDFLSMDVSFISTTKIMINILNLLKENAKLVILIKPQFETTREKVEKGGIVRKKETHIEVLKNVVFFHQENGLNLLNLHISPIRGRKGNIEYLGYFSKSEKKDLSSVQIINKINSLVDEVFTKN